MSDTYDMSGDFDGIVNAGSRLSNVQQTVNIYNQGPAPPRTPLQRPLRAAHFVDREADLSQLLADLRPGRVVTLCGPGGIGKSALAAEAVWKLAPGDRPPVAFPGGIVCHTFYHQPQADLALEAIARAYGEEPKPTPLDAAQRALAGRTALLLLDGTEEADNLERVLAAAGGCGVIVTSRSSDDAVSGWQDVTPLPAEDAVDLLQAWGGQWAADRAVAGRICEMVGRLPLAVRLAGRYLASRRQPAVKYLAWLERSPLKALDQGHRRDRSVPILLERSLAQIEDELACQALAVLGRLALAPVEAGVVAAALAAPAEEIEAALGKLVSYGLLLPQAGNRYNVGHALIHRYARERVELPEAAMARLAGYYDTLAREQRELGPPGYARLDRDRAHLMAALAGCVEREMWEPARSLVWAVEDYLDMCGYSIERVAALEAGVEAACGLGYRRDEGAFLGNLGLAYRALGQVERAIEYHQQALAIAREIGDRLIEGNQLGSLGLAYSALGQVERAIEYYEQALVIAREIGDRRNEGIHLGNLGNAYSDLGQVERAIEYHQQALVISREIGDRRGEGADLGSLGLAYSALGQVERAIEYYEQALAIAREIGDRRGEGANLGNLGLAYSDLGQVERAIEYHQQALVISREIGDRRGEGANLGNLGLAYSDLGQVERAIEYHQQALAIAREIGNRRSQGNQLGNLGLAYRALGQVERAIEYYEQALVIAREIGNRRSQGNQLGNLGLAYRDLGQVERAIEYHQQALVISREIGDRRGEGADLGSLGLAYSALGQVERAIEYYEQALAIAREIGDRRNEGNHLGNLGNVYRALGQVERAIEYYEQALTIQREIGDRRGEANQSWNLGLLYADGDPARAVALMSVCVAYEQEIGHPAAAAHAARVAQIEARLGG